MFHCATVVERNVFIASAFVANERKSNRDLCRSIQPKTSRRQKLSIEGECARALGLKVAGKIENHQNSFAKKIFSSALKLLSNVRCSNSPCNSKNKAAKFLSRNSKMLEVKLSFSKLFRFIENCKKRKGYKNIVLRQRLQDGGREKD